MFFLILTLFFSSIVFLFSDVARWAESALRCLWRALEKLNSVLQMALFCLKHPKVTLKIVWSLVSRVILPYLARAWKGQHGGERQKTAGGRVKFEERVEDLAPAACQISNMCLVDKDGRNVITEEIVDLSGGATLREAMATLASQESNFGEDLVLLVTYDAAGGTYRKALSRECLQMTLDVLLLEGPDRRHDPGGEELASIIQQEIESTPLPLNRLFTVDFFDANDAELKDLPDGIEDVVYSLMGPIGLLSSSRSPRLTQSGQSVKCALLALVRSLDLKEMENMKRIEKMEIVGTLYDQKVCL